MTLVATAVYRPLPLTLPAWATKTLVGDHVPLPGPWTCDLCPDRPCWPCPPARSHLADVAMVTPMSGWVWLHWVFGEARTDLPGEHIGVLRARMLGWYEHQVGRVAAYRSNRAGRWRRWRHLDSVR